MTKAAELASAPLHAIKKPEASMRFKLAGVGAVLLSSIALAQTPTAPELHLRGDRFRPLTYSELTPAQKAMVDDMMTGERKGVMSGPFNTLLRSPEMGDAAQKLGAQVRFHSVLPNRLNEMAILITARFWNAQYDWWSHHKQALAAGLSPAVIDAISAGKRPASMQSDEEIIYNFADELLRTKQVSDASFQAVVGKFGETGAVDLTGVMGYYSFVSMVLNVDRYPMPEGVKPELKPLP
jgi:4-carboxymuconolactone decarboxylase